MRAEGASSSPRTAGREETLQQRGLAAVKGRPQAQVASGTDLIDFSSIHLFTYKPLDCLFNIY